MDEWDGGDRREHKWHLDKSVSIGHIITTLALAGSVFAWAMKMDTRVSVIETQVIYAADARKKLEVDYHNGFGEIKSSLIRIEDKLDRKVDK